MSASLKPGEVASFRRLLEGLSDRLRGNADRMTEGALRRGDDQSNLSNAPLRMADVGTENYDQEFTLGLIQDEQETLRIIDAALGRVDASESGAFEECGGLIARARLQALPYTRYCIESARKLENPA